MPLTLTSTDVIVSSDASTTHKQTYTTTLTITPNPLTTVFEPPSYCTQSYLSNCQTDAVPGTIPCFVSLYPEGVCDSNGQSCYPAVPGALDNTYLYSPGLACPTGWTTAWQEVKTPAGQEEETTAHCCPSGLSVTTYGIYSTWCEGTVTDGEQTILVNGLSECPSSTTAFAFGPNTPVDLTWVNVDSTRVTASGVAVFTVSAEQVALLYRSSDLASVVATRSSVTASASSTGRASDTGIVGGGGGPQGNGISNGAIAGIAIGAAAVGIAAVLGAVYLFSRHRRGKRTARLREKELNAAGGRPPTGPGAGYHASQPRTMPASDSRQPSSPKRQYELNASASESSRVPPVIAERPVQSSSVVELYGSTPGREQPLTEPSSQGNGETLRHNYQGVVESGGIYEVSATGHGYQQLPISPARKHMDESRQNTPVDLDKAWEWELNDLTRQRQL